MNKKRKIDVSPETFQFLDIIRKDIGSFDQVLKNYINDPSFSTYAKGRYQIEGRNSLLRLPFYVRLFIIEMVADGELKYFLRQNGVIKSFQKFSDISMSEYIKELFGVFKEDRSRKIFLIFRRMGIKTSSGIQKRFRIIPQKCTLLSFRFHGGQIVESEETILNCIPSGFNGLHEGIMCLTFVYIRNMKVDSLICLINQFRFLDRLRFSETDLTNVPYQQQEKLIKCLEQKESVSIIRCKGFVSEIISRLFLSKRIKKLAIGGNQFLDLSYPETPTKNDVMKFLYLQNNITDVKVKFSNFPNLRIINVSNTGMTYNNLINLMAHPILRKLVVVHVRINLNEEIEIEEVNSQYLSNRSEDDGSQHRTVEFRKPSQRLEFLSLSSTRIDERFCRYIGKWCKSITTLMISKCSINPHKFSLLKLDEKKSLQVLHIGWNKISNENMKVIIEKCPSLSKLVTPQERIDKEFAMMLTTSKSLESLSFRSKIELEISPDIIESIRTSKLKYLNLIHHNSVSVEDIEYIKFHCHNIEVFKYSYPTESERITWIRDKFYDKFMVPEGD